MEVREAGIKVGGRIEIVSQSDSFSRRQKVPTGTRIEPQQRDGLVVPTLPDGPGRRIHRQPVCF